MGKRLLIAWGVLVGFFTLWAALAQIAPDLFVIKGNPLPAWVRSPNLVWISLPLTVFWLVAAFWRLFERFSKLEAEPQQRDKTFQLWLNDRNREIAERYIAEYRTLESNISNIGAANATALNDFHKTYNRRLEALEQRQPQKFDDTARAALGKLLARGDELLSRAMSIPEASADTEVECRHAFDAIIAWEQEVLAWLKSSKIDFEQDFLAGFPVPKTATTNQTIVRRIECRLDRLRAVKAALS